MLDAFKELSDERDRLMLTTVLTGGEVDFSGLRTICQKYNANCENIFELEASDQQLLKSVNTFFRELLEKS